MIDLYQSHYEVNLIRKDENRFALYQGTTSVVPSDAGIEWL